MFGLLGEANNLVIFLSFYEELPPPECPSLSFGSQSIEHISMTKASGSWRPPPIEYIHTLSLISPLGPSPEFHFTANRSHSYLKGHQSLLHFEGFGCSQP